MREYHGPQHQKAKTSGVCCFCPSVPAGPHPLLVDPDHENTACRRVAPVAPKCQVSSFTLDAQPTHPSSRVLQHQQSGGHSYVCSCRNASSSRTSSPPRHHSAGSLAHPAPPTEITNITASDSIPPEFTTPTTGRSQAHQDQQEPHQTNAKKKRCTTIGHQSSHPPLTASISTQPTRPHRAYLAAVPCRSPRPTQRPTSLLLHLPEHHTRERSPPRKKGSRIGMSASVVRACLLAALAKGGS